MTIQVRYMDDGDREILLYGIVGSDFFDDDGLTGKDVAAALKGARNVTLRINSPGGDFFEGVTIHSQLKSHPHPVHVRIDGLAASAASLIAMAGDTVEMAPGSMLMIHKPWSFAMGEANELRSAADRLDKLEQGAIAIYADRSGMTGADIAEMAAAETWLTVDEAVEFGFADRVDAAADEPGDTPAMRVDYAPQMLRRLNIHNPPAALMAREKEPTTVSDTDFKAEFQAVKLTAENLRKDHMAATENLSALLDAIGAESPDEAKGIVAALRQSADNEKALRAEVASLREQSESSERAGIVETLMSEGKLTPHQRDNWVPTLPLEALKAFAATAPRVVPKSSIQPPSESTGGGVETYKGKTWSELVQPGNTLLLEELHRTDPDKYRRMKLA